MRMHPLTPAEIWEAERKAIEARDARRRERAAADLPLVPAALRVWLVGLFGALALAGVCAYMWGG